MTNRGLTGDAPRDQEGEVVDFRVVQDVVVAEVGVVGVVVATEATETNELAVVGEEEEGVE